MLSCMSLQLPTDTLHRLLDFLRNTGSGLNAAEAADQAVREWIDRMGREGHPGRVPDGYQWKTLFLPEGTRLTVFCQTGLAHAYVVGSQLLYQGEPTSPNRFAKEASGYVRNAWTDITVRYPGEIRAKMASVLRREQERAAAAKASQPPPEVPRAYCPPSQPPPEPPVLFESQKPPLPADEWPYIDRRALRVYTDWEPF